MYDVAIVGAGVIGSCVARELSKFKLKVVVIEKEHDVSCGASRANSGIVHGGYDAVPGTLKAKFNILGQRMFDRLSKELDFSFQRNGSLVIAFNDEEVAKLEQLKERGETNGLTNLKIVSRDELKKLEPNLSDDACAALVVPDGGVVCSYGMTIAFAENAAENGVEFMLDCPVTGMVKENGKILISTAKGLVESKMVINAAGVYSDEINNMLSDNKLKIVPRRGEYCLIDRAEGKLVKHTVFQLPTKKGKGILIIPTVDGNIMLGPTAVDIEEKDNTATTMIGLDEVLTKARLTLNRIPTSHIITSFAGLRAHLESEDGDFLIEESADVKGLINLCGIESPGLTSAPAIGVYVAGLVKSMLKPKMNESFNPIRKRTRSFRNMTNEERQKAIEKDPNYGHIICRCESVTKAEVIGVLRSPIKVYSFDAIKRRTRAGMGRCQGGFCWMRLIEIISDECGKDVTEIVKSSSETNILIGRNKVASKKDGDR